MIQLYILVVNKQEKKGIFCFWNFACNFRLERLFPISRLKKGIWNQMTMAVKAVIKNTKHKEYLS